MIELSVNMKHTLEFCLSRNLKFKMLFQVLICGNSVQSTNSVLAKQNMTPLNSNYMFYRFRKVDCYIFLSYLSRN